jgi:hypothetical protein
MYLVHTSTGFLYWYVPSMYISKFICESMNQYVPARVTTVFRGMMNMDRGELGKTTASVSNYKVNIDYYIGLLYNCVEILVWEISERCIESL